MSEEDKSTSPLSGPEAEDVLGEGVKVEEEKAGAESPDKKEEAKEGKVILKVSGLTRNVKEDHLKEIFSRYGKVEKVYFGCDKAATIPTGTSYIKFEMHKDAKNAEKYMDYAQIDGARISAYLTSSVPTEYTSHRYDKTKPLLREDYKSRHRTTRNESQPHSNSHSHLKSQSRQRSKHSHHRRKRSESPKKRRGGHERRGKSRSSSYSSSPSGSSYSSSPSSSSSSSRSGSYTSSYSSSPSSSSYSSSSSSSSSSRSISKSKDGHKKGRRHHTKQNKK